MTARIFTPVMSEMQRMLRGAGGSGGVVFSDSVGQSPAVFASLHRPDGSAVARVRRILFGPVDHEDTRRFVDRELALQKERDTERWGFDFLLERERTSGPGTKRYIWQRVTPDEKIPEPYALRGMQYLGKREVSSDEDPKPATTALEVVAATSTATSTKQTVISGKKFCAVVFR
jgi:Cyclin-dependent kinase inhibitor.